MSDYQMPDFTGASCAGLGIDMFYDEVVVEKVVEVGIGDSTYNMTRSTAPIQHAYLRKVCLGCPVLQECREWGILHEEYGFWGGLTATERASERVLRGIKVDEPSYIPPTREVSDDEGIGYLPTANSSLVRKYIRESESIGIDYVINPDGISEGQYSWM